MNLRENKEPIVVRKTLESLRESADRGMIRDMNGRKANSKALGAFLALKRDEAKLTNAQLARLTGLSDSYLPQLFRGIRSNGEPLEASKPTVLVVAAATRMSRDDTRRALELAGFGSDDKMADLVWSALGDPHDLTSEELRQVIAVANAILRERDRSRDAARDATSRRGQSAQPG